MNYATAEAEDNREKILKFIVKYIKRHCYPPATYEIAADTGLSKATVRRHIAMLLEDRILETEHPGDSRAYRIKDTKIVMVKEKKNEVDSRWIRPSTDINIIKIENAETKVKIQ